MNFNGKTVLVYGYGKSGKSAAKLLNKKGANVKVYDDDYSKKDYLIFEEWAADFKDVDLVVVSPAVSSLKGEILELKLSGVPVISEIELGYETCAADVIAVTGTNGKTTTTKLINAVLNAGGINAYELGNIGTPFTEMSDKLKKSDVAVVEVSSFQLEGVRNFSPEISVLLNVEPDHLDRHKSIECYENLKSRIFAKQSEKDYLVANVGDDRVKRIIENAAAKVIPFSLKEKCDGGYVLNGSVYFKDEKVIDVLETPFKGRELENLLACVCVAKLLKIDNETILKVVKDFKKPSHRVEFVGVKNGKNIFDDSKATNVSATISAIEGLTDDTVLILGGSDKGEEYPELFEHFSKKVKRVLVCGENSKSVMHAATLCGFRDIKECSSLEDCVLRALDGEEKTVLFSPAAKSFDRYSSYAERGDKFKEIVEKL